MVTILIVGLLVANQAALGAAEEAHPSESECRPYIEKALKEKDHPQSLEFEPSADDTPDQTQDQEGATEGGGGSNEANNDSTAAADSTTASTTNDEKNTDSLEDDSKESKSSEEQLPQGDDPSAAAAAATATGDNNNEAASVEDDHSGSKEENDNKSVEDDESGKEKPSIQEDNDSKEGDGQNASVENEDNATQENVSVEEDQQQVDTKSESQDKQDVESGEDNKSVEEDKSDENKSGEDKDNSEEEKKEPVVESVEDTKEEKLEKKTEASEEGEVEKDDGKKSNADNDSHEDVKEEIVVKTKVEENDTQKEEKDDGKKTEEGEEEENESSPEEEDLTLGIVIPDNLRARRHVHDILKLDDEFKEEEELVAKTVDTTLKELKRLYDNTIKPLETLYKYRDLSNRHFGDPEIFSKPLVLFMGPWSGGKSSIINYLLDNEYNENSLRTGAEPSPAYFNILSWGESPTILDGTQLAADWTFSGLQKFGQGLLDRLRGLQLPHPLLEKINIVEIPGILEIRKQVERQFPFNDACQWFIDRADIIFLVYDPSKLDVGPETEAILDQLKGREYQTRIILNKADQVKPEELMRVQGTLIWNISPLMSSSEPPVMYSTSLWSNPYELGAPIRLLQAQENAFLRDLRYAIDKRVENKIASARRFAVRVRNHAKMVDCYLTTYYNHKTFFGNRKKVADDIIEHPQNYHIYAGLSTLTNISRYDLPDPEVYRDFFRLNPVFEFKKLSDTCTYFRGCPINRLDVTIAYDLPELVGKYKKTTEQLLRQHAENKLKKQTTPSS